MKTKAQRTKICKWLTVECSKDMNVATIEINDSVVAFIHMDAKREYRKIHAWDIEKKKWVYITIG